MISVLFGIAILAVLIFLVLLYAGVFKQTPNQPGENTTEYEPTLYTTGPCETTNSDVTQNVTNDTRASGDVTQDVTGGISDMTTEQLITGSPYDTSNPGTDSKPDDTTQAGTGTDTGSVVTTDHHVTTQPWTDITTSGENSGQSIITVEPFVTSQPVVTTQPLITTRPFETTEHVNTIESQTTIPFITTGPEDTTSVNTTPETTEITPVTPDVTTVPISPETTEPMETYAIPENLTDRVEYRDVLIAPNGDLVPGYWLKDSTVVLFFADLPELELYDTYKWWSYNELYRVLEYGTYIKNFANARPGFVADNPLPPYVHPGTQDTSVYTIPPGTWW